MYNFFIPRGFKVILLLSLLFVISCTSSSKVDRGEVLFATNCTSCHLAPSIKDLPKEMWIKRVFPDMGARMGMQSNDKLESAMVSQLRAIRQSGIIPETPMMQEDDWELLKNYIINLALESLPQIKNNQGSIELSQFTPKPISLDSKKGTFITYLKYDVTNKRLLTGDITGSLFEYNYIDNQSSFLNKYGSAITDYTEKDSIIYATAVGHLNPSENASGKIFVSQNGITDNISQLHRPVNSLVLDLNKNGKNELVISEFGNLTGKLSLYTKGDADGYQKSVLSELPGAIRTLSKDMDKDGKDDLITLFAQGDENITIFYQKEKLNFEADKVLRFSPIYGSSWFEIIDYNGDGYDDIITVNGDNADHTYVHKPYHGLRIHINDGNNNFEEKYFYTMNGATRFVANDFDQDGDIDFGIISTFPDYDNKPEFSFVYLENNDAEAYKFTVNTFKDANDGRWFLMDTGDIDDDGDEDIILSSFTYVFTPVPEELMKLWNSNKLDIMVLENKLK